MLCVTSGQPHFGWLLRRCSPLPISNREVKPACADGTAMQCGRVGSCPFFQEAFGRISFQRLFCVLWKWNTKNIVVYLLLFAKPFLSIRNKGLLGKGFFGVLWIRNINYFVRLKILLYFSILN